MLGNLSGIISDVLIIEMFSTRKLNIDLIDLPGNIILIKVYNASTSS